MSNLQQTLVLRLLFGPSTELLGDEGAEHTALLELQAWGLLDKGSSSGGVSLMPHFAASLMQGLESSGAVGGSRMADVMAHRAQEEALARWWDKKKAGVCINHKNYPQKRESAIQFLGDPLARFGRRAHEPSVALVQTALQEEILTSKKRKKKNTEPQDCVLTQSGFKFLLADPHEQMWRLILGYIKMRMSKVRQRMDKRDLKYDCGYVVMMRFELWLMIVIGMLFWLRLRFVKMFHTQYWFVLKFVILKTLGNQGKMSIEEAAAAVGFVCSLATGECFRRQETNKNVGNDVVNLCVSLGETERRKEQRREEKDKKR
jgi:hypothetical protein